MRAEDVIAILYDRGLRPVVDDAEQTVDWAGVGINLTPALRKVLDLHLTRVTALVLQGFTPRPADYEPPTSDARPGAGAFDHDAEKAVRDFYSVGAGLTWTGCPDRPLLVNRRGVNPAALDAVMKRCGPLRERIAAHLAPRVSSACDLKGFESKGRHAVEYLWETDLGPRLGGLSRSVHYRMYEVSDVGGHLFKVAPLPPPFRAWRNWGEEHWRAFWGRWVQTDGRLVFAPYGV